MVDKLFQSPELVPFDQMICIPGVQVYRLLGRLTLANNPYFYSYLLPESGSVLDS